MITFETKAKLQAAILLEGDVVQLLGEDNEADVSLRYGRVRKSSYISSNPFITIANGLKVELFPDASAAISKDYVDNLVSRYNLLSNHNFLIQTPDDTLDRPDTTPRNYPPGYQIFSGVFANETVGITNLTYIDGHVSFSGGDFYFPVPNSGGIEKLTEFAASVADFDGKPRTRGVSYALVGDEYRITVTTDALEDASSVLTPLGSVKFEQGSVATGHEVQSSKGQIYCFNSIVDAIANCPNIGSLVSVEDYYGGANPNNSGVLFFKVVSAGTGTADGGKYIDVDPTRQLEQNLKKPYSIKAWGAMVDATTDDTQSVKNTTSYVASLDAGGYVFFPNGGTLMTEKYIVPYKVSVIGESKGNRSQTNEDLGSYIIKGHSDDAVLFNRSLASYQVMEKILILGYHPSNTAGRGIVIQTQGSVVLKECAVYAVYGNAYHVGGGSNFTYAVEFDDCYVNTYDSTPNAFYIDAIDFRGTKLLSDGCKVSFFATENGDNWSLGNSRLEGFTDAGMRIGSQQGTQWGRLHIAGTKASGLFGVVTGENSTAIDFDYLTIDRSDIRTPGSIGLHIRGAASTVNCSKGTISSYDTSVLDQSGASSVNTKLSNMTMSKHNTGIKAYSNNSRYENIRFIDTQNICIDHLGGNNGLWTGNIFDKSGDDAIKPSVTGQSGNFGTNCVKNNIGYVTRNSGYVGALTSGDTINHGLSAAPLQNGSTITLTPSTGGITSQLAVQAPTDTDFKVIWTGTSTIGVRWEARLVCDY